MSKCKLIIQFTYSIPSAAITKSLEIQLTISCFMADVMTDEF